MLSVMSRITIFRFQSFLFNMFIFLFSSSNVSAVPCLLFIITEICLLKPCKFLILIDFSSEMKKLCQSGYTRGLILGPFFVSQKMIIFVTFLVFVLGEGGMLTAERVYITVSIYKGIQLSTTLFIPLAVQFLAECRISIDRFKVS